MALTELRSEQRNGSGDAGLRETHRGPGAFDQHNAVSCEWDGTVCIE
jgi:hypothetical protein